MRLYKSGDERRSTRLIRLTELENLNADKLEIENQLKKAKQLGKKVDLNTEVKQINNQIEKIKRNI